MTKLKGKQILDHTIKENNLNLSTLSINTLDNSGYTLNVNGTARFLSSVQIDTGYLEVLDGGIKTDYVLYSSGSTVSLLPGLRRLNTYIGTTEMKMVGHDVTIQDGFEVLGLGYNESLVTIPNGTPITIVGGVGSGENHFVIIEPAIASDALNSKYRVYGVTTEDILPSSFGVFTKIGEVHQLNLSYFDIGDDVFLSQSVAGGLVKPSDLSIIGRYIEIGRVVSNSPTDGVLSLSIHNEIGISNNTAGEINTFTTNDTSSGVFSFSGITRTSNTTFNVGEAHGWIVDNETNPLNPIVKHIEYMGEVGLTTPYLTGSTVTYILLDVNSQIVLQSTSPTPTQRRENIYLGRLGHADKTNITIAFYVTDSMLSPLSQIRDMFIPIPLINNGVVPYVSTNLSLNNTSGYLYGLGISFPINSKDPSRILIGGSSPMTFQYRTRLGGANVNTTSIDPTRYDLNGVVTLIGSPAKQATNQRIFLLQDGTFRIQYGQVVYTDLLTAVSGVANEQFETFINLKDNGILIGILSVRTDASNLSDENQAKLLLVSKFGEVVGASGGISTTTLQKAYDNSNEPEIITNSLLDGFTLRRGSNSDLDNLLVFENGNGDVVATVNGMGTGTFNSIVKTGGTSTQFLKADGSVDPTKYIDEMTAIAYSVVL